MPPRNYSIQLHDRWVRSWLKQLALGKIYQISTPRDFPDTYFNGTIHEQNLLCEL